MYSYLQKFYKTPIFAKISCYQLKYIFGNNLDQILIAKIHNEQKIFQCVKLNNLNQKELQHSQILRNLLLKQILEKVNQLKSLKHFNFLSIEDIIQTKNNIFIISEFYSIRTLQDYLKSSQKITVKESLSIFKHIDVGSLYLYSKGICHRNLKPSNIFISGEDTKLCKIGGIEHCQIIPENWKQTRKMKGEGGTAAYMAPQMVYGQQYTIKCDVWSLGVILFRLIFNLYPFEIVAGTTERNLTYNHNQIKDNDVQFPINDNQTSPSIKYLISDMLSYKEEQRIDIKEVNEVIQHLIYLQDKK